MGENSILQTTGYENEENGGCSSWLIFTAKGFIFPCGSASFYKTASKKYLISAVVFFLLFAIVITSVSTLQVFVAMSGIGDEIQGTYDRGEFPTIVIEDGIAQVDGPQPLIFEENRNIFAIDTTGGMKEIDTRSYSQGILLTRTEIHLVNEDGYEVFPLIDLNEGFGNPIVVDKAQALTLWKTISLWTTILAFLAILIWNSLIRFVYIMLLGLVIWGIVSIKQKGIAFSPILITGIYANVPVIYLRFTLKLVNISFFCLYTILLVAIWVLVLRVVLRNTDVDKADNPVAISISLEE
ncbi:MAG: DUF1189 domain-containing protein [Chloroflexi bacterium]|nr:DUF1189 domain-containing protein [Chloroflexota bacterium]